MQIKRKLNALAKRLTPSIEIMNVADEMHRMCNRFDELLTYAEEKEARAKDLREGKRETVGAKVQKQKAKERAEIAAAQKAEADENLADQKEAFDKRNKRLQKSQPEKETTDK